MGRPHNQTRILLAINYLQYIIQGRVCDSWGLGRVSQGLNKVYLCTYLPTYMQYHEWKRLSWLFSMQGPDHLLCGLRSAHLAAGIGTSSSGTQRSPWQGSRVPTVRWCKIFKVPCFHEWINLRLYIFVQAWFSTVFNSRDVTRGGIPLWQIVATVVRTVICWNKQVTHQIQSRLLKILR